MSWPALACLLTISDNNTTDILRPTSDIAHHCWLQNLQIVQLWMWGGQLSGKIKFNKICCKCNHMYGYWVGFTCKFGQKCSYPLQFIHPTITLKTITTINDSSNWNKWSKLILLFTITFLTQDPSWIQTKIKVVQLCLTILLKVLF